MKSTALLAEEPLPRRQNGLLNFCVDVCIQTLKQSPTTFASLPLKSFHQHDFPNSPPHHTHLEKVPPQVTCHCDMIFCLSDQATSEFQSIQVYHIGFHVLVHGHGISRPQNRVLVSAALYFMVGELLSPRPFMGLTKCKHDGYNALIQPRTSLLPFAMCSCSHVAAIPVAAQLPRSWRLDSFLLLCI